jgi:V/A-type H+-transporting ATPase subunit C
MLRAAARYGYVNAKVRGLRSRNLTEQDYHFLLAAKDLTAFFSYLGTTSYSAYLPDPEEEIPKLSVLERQLSRPLMRDYTKIAHALTGHKERTLILALFRRFEAENLKLVLRAIFAKLDREDVLHLLYPLGRLSTLNWDALWAAGTVREIPAYLRPEVFGQSLQHALPQFEAQGRLFPLEMALDFSCFRCLQEAVQNLGSRHDRRVAQKVLGPYIDIINISWVIRLKTVYGLSPEETVNYTLPERDLVTLSCLNQLARAEDTAAFIKHLPPVFQHELPAVNDWPSIAFRLQSWFIKILARVFAGSPFHIGIAIAYLLEKEIELANLITLLQVREQRLSVEVISKKMPVRFMVGGYVQAG